MFANRHPAVKQERSAGHPAVKQERCAGGLRGLNSADLPKNSPERSTLPSAFNEWVDISSNESTRLCLPNREPHKPQSCDSLLRSKM